MKKDWTWAGLSRLYNAMSTWLDPFVIIQNHFLAKNRYCAYLAG